MRKQVLIGDRTFLDLPALIRSRLLVQANSGGGKSYLLRRLLEQTHGKVQQLVIDVEGEFGTLREKFDYVLAAKEGDTPAEPRAAAMLAERLLELKVSAILDLYELKHDSRLAFVQAFLDALVNAPKKLWHPVLVIVDEAHVFCPQQGKKESPSASSVIDLCTRGRKRGFCAVLATQRLSKLHKDAAAECNNVLIGRTSLDVDMDRSAEALGFRTNEQRLSLRDLKPGEFFAYGPALSKTVTHVQVGPVLTTHPKSGGGRTRLKHAPKPTKAIKKLLPKLADLPEESEQRELSIRQLKAQLVEWKNRANGFEHQILAAAIHGKVLTEPELAAIKRTGDDIRAMYDELTGDAALASNKFVNTLVDKIRFGWQTHERKLTKAQYRYAALLRRPSIKKVVEFFGNQRDRDPSLHRLTKADIYTKSPNFSEQHTRTKAKAIAQISSPPLASASHKVDSAAVMKLLRSEKTAHRKMFSAIIDFPGAGAKKLSALTAISPNVSTFRLAITKLRNMGLVSGDTDGFQLTKEGQAAAAQFPSTLSASGLQGVDRWRSKLTAAPLRLFEALLTSRRVPVSAETLGQYAKVDHTVSTFRLGITKLRKLDLLDEKNGLYAINEELL